MKKSTNHAFKMQISAFYFLVFVFRLERAYSRSIAVNRGQSWLLKARKFMRPRCGRRRTAKSQLLT
jgi:hypothetical protein